MPVKIRLQRRGRKFASIYQIVVADSRAPRDGKYIESLGQYNPGSNPATITLDFDRSLHWLQNGAQPTDTCRTILSYKGVLYKKHLLDGVKKGAFDEAEAEKRFQAWMKEKEAKIQSKIDQLADEQASELKKRLEAEKKISEARAAEIAKLKSELLEKEAAQSKAASGSAAEEAEEAEAPAAEEAVAEEAVAEEAAPAEAKEEAAEEVKQEAPEAEAKEEVKEEAPEAKEEAKEEVKEEAPEAEAKEETPEAEAEEEKKEDASSEGGEEEKK